MSFVLIAHRGHQGLAPESTIAAFDAAIQAGFPHIEMDVQLTQDNTPIVLHDEFLGRTVTGSGHTADYTWDQLRDLDAGSWYTNEQPDWSGGLPRISPDFSQCRIPTLDQVLTRYLGKIHLHLELKSNQDGLPHAVAASLKSCGWLDDSGHVKGGFPDSIDSAFTVPGLTITSFHLSQLEASKGVLPGVRHAWLVHEVTDELLQKARVAMVTQLCPLAELLTPAIVSKVKSYGFSVRAWGLKEDKNLLAAKRCGAQGGTVDNPTHASEFLHVHKQGQPTRE